MKLSFTLLLVIPFFSCNTDAPKEQVPVIAPATDTQAATPPATQDSSELTSKTYKAEDGWGYDILENGKVLIHQPIIPAVAGNRHFSSEEKAATAANFAIAKMKSSGTLPTLTIAELDSLGVTK